MINNNLLQYLCCPQCKAELKKEETILVCQGCGQRFGIEKGIPVLVDLENLPSHLSGQIKYFERENERRLHYRLQEWQKSYLRRFEENLPFKEGEVLIDAGTGSGYMAVELAKKGLRVFTCDLTLKELLKLKEVVLKESLQNNLFLICCTLEELPLKTGIADYLVSNAVLEHLPKEKEAIAEFSRVCKKKSGMMIAAPIKFCYLWPFLWLPTFIHDKRIGHLRKYDKKDLTEKFGRFGYQVKKIYYPGHLEKALIVSLSILGIKRESWDKWAEKRDRQKEHKKYGASNICIIFKR